jgi:hypothetical protein
MDAIIKSGMSKVKASYVPFKSLRPKRELEEAIDKEFEEFYCRLSEQYAKVIGKERYQAMLVRGGLVEKEVAKLHT